MAESWTTLRVLDWTAGRFADAGFDSPRLEAQVLLAHVLECDRVALYTGFDKPLGPDELGAYRELIRRRLAGEPVAYLVGHKEFWSLRFAVDHRVLIPRPDTETLIEAIFDHLGGDRTATLRIADIGTGSGVIAITLARQLPNATVVATDVDAAALLVATSNAEANQVSDRVSFRSGDLLAPFDSGERFDLVAANLPYVAAGELEHLSREVGYEPPLALDGGADGLGLIRRLVAEVASYLDGGGLLVLEHGPEQDQTVAELIAATGSFETVRLRRDLAGRARVTAAVRRSSAVLNRESRDCSDDAGQPLG